MRREFVTKTLATAGMGVLLLLAAPVAVVSLPLLAQDANHAGAIDVRQHGYRHGFRDGYDYGRDARARGVALDYQTDNYRAADHGYWEGLGPIELFRTGYQEGYRDGAQDGFNGVRTRLERLFAWSDRNFDPDRGGDVGIAPEYRNPGWKFQDVAADIGYRDGVNAGLRDFNEHHSYRPTEHGAWKDATRGYSNAFGDKGAYKAAYRSAYEAGYKSGFGEGMGLPK